MFEQEIIRDKLQILRAGVSQAIHQYDALPSPAGAPQAAEYFDRLRRDKRRHLRLTERLLEIVD